MYVLCIFNSCIFGVFENAAYNLIAVDKVHTTTCCNLQILFCIKTNWASGYNTRSNAYVIFERKSKPLAYILDCRQNYVLLNSKSSNFIL
jgi:hypothetical protein